MGAQAAWPSLLISSPGRPDPVWSMLAISVCLHLVVLLVAANFRYVRSADRPLSKEYEVSLVTLAMPVKPEPAPMVRPAAPTLPPKPAPAPVRPEAPPPKAAEVVTESPPPPAAPLPRPAEEVTPPPPAEAVTPPAPVTPALPRIAIPALNLPDMTSAKKNRSKTTVESMMRDVTLPPDAPELGDVKPPQVATAPRRSPPEVRSQNLQQVMQQLAVPDARPVAPPMGVPTVPSPTPAPAPSQAERIEKVLQALPPAASLQPRGEISTAKREPAPATSVPVAKASPPVETRMQVKSQQAGSNEYLARVQAKISEQWVAPPVDASLAALTVVVRFRLHRDGAVTQITIEKSSGNGYYDDAGRRAVQAASPLPPFPVWLTDSSLDAHFTFSVGQQAG